jgi:hypothetical protein
MGTSGIACTINFQMAGNQLNTFSAIIDTTLRILASHFSHAAPMLFPKLYESTVVPSHRPINPWTARLARYFVQIRFSSGVEEFLSFKLLFSSFNKRIFL